MNDKYPKILIPEVILEIKKSTPPLPTEPNKPKYPEKKIFFANLPLRPLPVN